MFTRYVKDNLEEIAVEIADRVLAAVPVYERLPHAQLVASTKLLVVHIVDEHDQQSLPALLQAASTARVEQDIGLSDFLCAIHQGFPVFQRHLRLLGPAVPQTEADRVDARFHQVAVAAAEAFSNALQRTIRDKNRELNRLAQLLSEDVRAKSAALDAATELHRRVVESLSSGLVVVDRETRHITLYSSRMEEITTLPTQEVVGRHVAEAFAPLGGLDVAEMLSTVEREGRLPLRKLRITLPSGRRRSVLVRGERLLGAEGDPEGTVVVVDDVSERELLIDSFSRYVSSDVVKKVLDKGEMPGLEGERQVCTVMFADIRGFTTLAEGMSAEALHEVLNAYFRVMIAVIHDSGGFIDKFVGDMIMSLFVDPDPGVAARAALGAAAGIKRVTSELSVQRRAQGLAPIDVGIGINTGEALIGNIGSELRMDFTAIGDTVNVAARLQSLAKQGQVFCGTRTASLAGPDVQIQRKGPQPVKGRDEPVVVWELLPTNWSKHDSR